MQQVLLRVDCPLLHLLLLLVDLGLLLLHRVEIEEAARPKGVTRLDTGALRLLLGWRAVKENRLLLLLLDWRLLGLGDWRGH